MKDQILCGDNVTVLRGLPDACVQMCATSPPYYGLRDYGTAKWEGGSPECDHFRPRLGGNGKSSPINGGGSERDESIGLQQYKDVCGKCGALRVDNQIGLEETPELYVARLVEVFREVWRVMDDTGTLWLNLGDSYTGSHGNGNSSQTNIGLTAGNGFVKFESPTKKLASIKPKDLIGIPWMVAFALRADGWYLRSDIIWNKPNPMPESVTDRPTKSHEYIFLLSKRTDYYYDMEAIKEPSVTKEDRPFGIVHDREYGYDSKQAVLRSQRDSFKRNGSSRPDELVPGNGKNSHRPDRKEDDWDTDYRNKRSVWTVATKPYAEAHFATFPPDLIKPCILAGSKAGDVVLDPFFGSGTTGFVARELGRHFIGIDLNPEYIKLAERRISRANIPLPGLV